MRVIITLSGMMVVLTNGALARSAPASVWQPSPGHTQLPIWPNTPPDAQSTTKSESLESGVVRDVSRPTLTVYSPKGSRTGIAVIVFPGGGYRQLAIDLEGTEVCDWLTSKGITCVLLK